MTKFNCNTLLYVFVACISMSCGKYSSEKQNKSDFDIYILMGQSNMAGRGEITDEYRNLKDPNVLTLNKELEWIEARHPLHFDKPKVVGVGPGLSFGLEMAKVFPNKKIGLVPCAVGGTPIDKWSPGVYDKATDTHPWDDAVDRIREAVKYGEIKGIVWHQGEGDSSPEKSRVYLDKLTDLIQRVRKLTNKPNLPFVAGELGHYRDRYHNINRELQKLPELVPYTAVASAEGLTHNGDGTHLSSESAHELGVRMAEKMKSVQ